MNFIRNESFCVCMNKLEHISTKTKKVKSRYTSGAICYSSHATAKLWEKTKRNSDLWFSPPGGRTSLGKFDDFLPSIPWIMWLFAGEAHLRSIVSNIYAWLSYALSLFLVLSYAEGELRRGRPPAAWQEMRLPLFEQLVFSYLHCSMLSLFVLRSITYPTDGDYDFSANTKDFFLQFEPKIIFKELNCFC